MIFTTEQLADIYKASLDSVTLINRDANYDAYIERTASGETEDTWKAMIKRNVEHLEIIKAYKKPDNTTSVWTTEDFTGIDAAITKGKTFYS
tara:strand:- start:112 stop:387 length:276 start_codon:yes stop_codon:yes gene_type:complete